MDSKRGNERSLIFSYLQLRTVIGLLGIALPFVLAFGALLLFGAGIQTSISSYYHTGMRDVLVGTLFAVGFFLLSYRGYDRRDNIAGNLACLFAVGVALFPTAPDGAVTNAARVIGQVHTASAALLFLTLAYFSLFLFTQTDPNKTPSKRKLQRNRVYKACGYVIGVCILLIATYYFLPDEVASRLGGYRPVYWLETLALLAFGFSWFTKGEAILKDEGELPG